MGDLWMEANILFDDNAIDSLFFDFFDAFLDPYRHFLGKSAYVFLAMGLSIVLLTVLWITARNSSDQYVENDQKWRFVKLKTDVAIQVVVDSTERRYEADPGQFKKDVEDEEERRREMTTYMMQREELDSVGVRLKRQKKIE